MTSDPREADTPLSDKTAREPLGGAQQLGDLAHGQQSLNLGHM